ncbi:MAG: hypothetical protein OXH31_09710 [Gammaproteobacteria bacterium]|nr:hypothetical protein [Gammaproteobacteria bacterium]
MRKFTYETERAFKNSKQDRVIQFVFFDFLGLPVYIHNKRGQRQLHNKTWVGIEENLKVSRSIVPFPNRNTANITIPILDHPIIGLIRKILNDGWWKNRQVELFEYSLDPQEHLVERIGYAKYTIKSYCVQPCGYGNEEVTFNMEHLDLAGVQETDSYHKDAVQFHRDHYNSEIIKELIWSTCGVILGLLIGAWKQVVAIFKLGSLTIRRMSFRKRVFTFNTEPKIPGAMSAYKIKSDTLEEAKEKYCRTLYKKRWFLHKNNLGTLTIYVRNNTRSWVPFIYSLEELCKQENLQKWRELHPLKNTPWMPNEVARG